MPPDLSSFRTTLNVKIFNTIASNLSASSLDSTTMDKWGDKTKSYTSEGTLKAVPYNTFAKRTSYEPFGDLQEGETDMVFQYDSGIDTGWIIQNVNDDLMIIKDIEDYPYQGGVLVKIARLTKNH